MDRCTILLDNAASSWWILGRAVNDHWGSDRAHHFPPNAQEHKAGADQRNAEFLVLSPPSLDTTSAGQCAEIKEDFGIFFFVRQ